MIPVWSTLSMAARKYSKRCGGSRRRSSATSRRDAINPEHQNASGILDVVSAFCDWRRTEAVLDEG